MKEQEKVALNLSAMGSGGVELARRLEYRPYQSYRKGRRSVLMLLKEERHSRSTGRNSFYGKFGCAVRLPTD